MRLFVWAKRRPPIHPGALGPLLLVMGVLALAGGLGLALLFLSAARVAAIEGRSFRGALLITIAGVLAASIVAFACNEFLLTSVALATGVAAGAGVMLLLTRVFFKTTLAKALEAMAILCSLGGFIVAITAIALRH